MQVEVTPYQPNVMMHIDEQDFALWNDYNWNLDRGYVKRIKYSRDNEGNKIRTVLYFHRIIAGAKDGEFVDHIDRDRLNNKRDNLRIVTHHQNNQNREGQGAYWSDKDQKWLCYIRHNGKTLYLGRFDNYDEAFEVYRAKARELRGEYSAC